MEVRSEVEVLGRVGRESGRGRRGIDREREKRGEMGYGRGGKRVEAGAGQGVR